MSTATVTQLDAAGPGDVTAAEAAAVDAEQLAVLDSLFTHAHTAYAWGSDEVDDEVLTTALKASAHGPTAFNSQPLRVLAVRTPEQRRRLAAHLSAGNRDKTLAAPLTLVLAADAGFVETAETVFPAAPHIVRSVFADAAAAEPAARLNAALQAGYLITALRAVGLAVGPMTGADFAGIDAEFFPGTLRRSFVVVNVGRPTADSYRPRNPRVALHEVLQTV